MRHARGQSFPDWIALRSGRLPVVPDGVAFPENAEEVELLFDFARKEKARLIPYGGGTSVVGHVNPLPGESAVITVDLRRMGNLLAFSREDELATFGAGIFGPDLEAHLGAAGFTLGHFPQSFEFSTLGGWIAARSSGQQSLGYGRIERLFAGGTLVSPAGRLELPSFPASAAGPDLKEAVLGSEGRLGILTRATVRITPAPERELFQSFFFSTFERGLEAARALVQERLGLSMIRLANPAESATSMTLARPSRSVELLERYLSFRGAGADKCLLLVGCAGVERRIRIAQSEVVRLVRRAKGIATGEALGRHWKENRFRGPYLRNVLWEMGYGIDTLETAAEWSRIPHLVSSIEGALRNGLAPFGERVHVFTHLSHLYPSGSSLYTTYLFRLASTPEETQARWAALKSAAGAAIVAGGGTISHQHGVGLDHREYLEAEKGALGIESLRDLCRRFDPDGMMNPGKLVG